MQATIRENRTSTAASLVEQLKLWLPIDSLIQDGKPCIEWMEMADVVFAEPFFNQTVARVKKERKGRQSLITGLDELIRFEKVADSLSPSGLIFHSSRCGSTLVANACRSLSGSLVISEAPVLDKLVSRFFTDTDDTGTRELLYSVFVRCAASALGQRRFGNERHYFIKFSATSILQFQRIRRIWPKVPVLFLYRDPVEVMVSNLQNFPEWMTVESNPETSAAVVGVKKEDLASLSPEEFCARALGRFYNAVSSGLDENTLLCNYHDLSTETLLRIIEFFGLSISTEEAETIRQTCRLHSKDPSRAFSGDSDSKRANASALAREMAAKWAEAPYQRLVRLQNK
jgi:Sulfotransferase domain